MWKSLMLVIGVLLGLAAEAGPVNINTASRAELDAELIGVGEALADRIVRYREAHGPFKTPEEIQNVPYVGTRTFEKNRQNILVSGP